MNQEKSFIIAAVQASPVFLDLQRTVDKVCDLIHEAGSVGASLVVFPEAFVPGYPLWAWFIPAGHTHPLREVYAELHRNSIAVPDHSTDRICAAAKSAGVAVALGINEKNGAPNDSTLYNSLLYIGPDGNILGKHRKLIPTAAERLVWGRGDGSDLEVYELPFGRIGGLICWENYMPLARYALSAWGIQIYVAPTWDRGEPWLSTMRHIAKESRCVVIGCCQAFRQDDIPDRFSFKEKYLNTATEWINPGGSVIVDPDGKMLAGPVVEKEEILYAEIDPAQLIGPRWQLDIAGHYGRPDIFELRVHRRHTPEIQIARSEEPTGVDSDLDES